MHMRRRVNFLKIFFRETTAFTLIELLVVIAIMAVLATVIVVVINPAELLRQGRDASRLSDLAAINHALGLLQVDQVSASFGTANTVYVSIPDTSPTCANVGLPALPSGYTYACASTSTYTRVDGTGWIPANLSSLSTGSPLPRLPLDPVNTTSSGNYYSYIPGGSWELTSSLESQKSRYGGTADKASTDGGNSSVLYEVGSNMSLNPVNDTGLVGWWKMDEGSGTTTADSSGNGNTGTLFNSPVWTSASSCKVGRCLTFDGSSNYVDVGYGTSTLNPTNAVTMSMWINLPGNGINGGDYIVSKRGGPTGGYFMTANVPNAVYFYVDDATTHYAINSGTQPFPASSWYHLVGVYDSSLVATDRLKLYMNGAFISKGNGPVAMQVSNSNLRIGSNMGNYFTPGKIDDVRIYNRALSPAEVSALYNASK